MKNQLIIFINTIQAQAQAVVDGNQLTLVFDTRWELTLY